MKNVRLFILAAVAVLLISSCTKYEPDKRVAVLLDSRETTERWGYDMKYLKEAFAWYSELTPSFFDALDADSQVEQLRSVLESGITNIVLTPINYDVINKSGLLEKYPNLNVTCHSRLVFDNSRITYYSSCDVDEIGRLQANYLLQQYHASGKETMTLEMFAGPDGDYTSTHIYEGAYEILKPYIDNGSLIVKSGKLNFTQISLPEWSSKAASDEMKERLIQYYEGGLPNLILTPNDDCAIGVINAIDELHTKIDKYPAITGQDNSEEGQQYMKDGKLGMTVDLNVLDMCYNTAMIVNSMAQGTIPATPYYVNNGIINVPLIKCNIQAVYSTNQ